MAYDQQLADVLRRQENLEVALVTLMTVCKRWPDAPLVVQRAIDVGQHVLCHGTPPALSAADHASSSRYMNPSAKSAELESWFKAKADRITNPPQGFVGGHGYPDPEIYAWCDRLNALSRVCTLQSCAGHRCTTELHCGWCDEQSTGTANGVSIEDLGHVMNGQLWLWLDEKLSRYVYENATQLAALPCIEKVSVLWHVEGREIVDIVFRGAGTGDLDGSMTRIVEFFENGNRLCNLG